MEGNNRFGVIVSRGALGAVAMMAGNFRVVRDP
jgi:hypothetical protein